MSPDPEKIPFYKQPRSGGGLFRIVFYATATTGIILFAIPFTQFITALTDGGPEIRSVEVAPPPPPPPPEVEEPPEEIEEQETPPEIQPPPPMLNFSQLEVALEAGIGDAMGGGFGFGGFAVQPDAMEDIQLFDVKDLDELPRPLKQVAMLVPTRFKRERIDGRLRIEIKIDEQGNTEVIQILETSDRELNRPAIEAVEQWKWTPPKKNGEAVNARYVLPFGFNA